MEFMSFFKIFKDIDSSGSGYFTEPTSTTNPYVLLFTESFSFARVHPGASRLNLFPVLFRWTLFA